VHERLHTHRQTQTDLIAALCLSAKTILVCRYNDVAFIHVELHGKGSTHREHSDSTSCSIISCSGMEIFVYINRMLTNSTVQVLLVQPEAGLNKHTHIDTHKILGLQIKHT